MTPHHRARCSGPLCNRPGRRISAELPRTVDRAVQPRGLRCFRRRSCLGHVTRHDEVLQTNQCCKNMLHACPVDTTWACNCDPRTCLQVRAHEVLWNTALGVHCGHVNSMHARPSRGAIGCGNSGLGLHYLHCERTRTARDPCSVDASFCACRSQLNNNISTFPASSVGKRHTPLAAMHEVSVIDPIAALEHTWHEQFSSLS